MRRIGCFVVLLLFTVATAQAQHEGLRREIDRIAKTCNGRVGVAINLLETDDSVTYNNDNRYVLHSVAKLAIAMKMLREVDKGNFKMNQQVHINKNDLLPTYSPLRDLHPEGNFNTTIEVLLNYMISLSDNNACDIILKLLGGTKPVEDFVHNMGISAFALKASEAEMDAAWPVQYNNWCQPYTQVELIKVLYKGLLLSKSSNNYLQHILLATSTAPNRIKGLLPLGTPVGHKSGTSPFNDQKLAPATNDVGFIILPDGKHLAIAIFINDSTDPSVTRDLVIAKIARAAHNEFAKK